jgi:hypothetical protein
MPRDITWVIPLESRIADHEVVRERVAAIDLRLRDVGLAIHVDRHPHAMPMMGRAGGRSLRWALLSRPLSAVLCILIFENSSIVVLLKCGQTPLTY